MPDSGKRALVAAGKPGLLEALERLRPIEEEFPPIEDPLPRPSITAEDEIEPLR